MQDVPGELVGVLKKRKVAGVGQDKQTGARNGGRDISVCGRLIASSWSPSTACPGVAMVFNWSDVQFGWVAHILLMACDEFIVIFRGGKQFRVFVAGSFDIGGESRVLFDAINNARTDRY